MRNRIAVSLRRNWRKGVGAFGIAGLVIVAGAGAATASGSNFDIDNVFRHELDGPSPVMGDINNVYKGEIPDNQVGLRELNKHARSDIDNVHAAEIAKGSVSGSHQGGDSDIKAESITEKELSPGLQGKLGVSGYEVVGKEQRFAPGRHTITVECPDGKVAIGGGHQASADGDGGYNTEVASADLSGLSRTDDGTWQATSYTVAFDNNEATSPGGGNMRVRVTCAAVN